MNVKKQKKAKKGGLGRSLGELLHDNEELGNVENRVLMHKKDGTTVKIYNKVDSKMSAMVDMKADAGVDPKGIQTEALRAKATPPSRLSTESDERIQIGKTREEREEESRGIYRSGKPHVIPEGEQIERIRIGSIPKSEPEPEPERIVLDGKQGSEKSVSEALGKLKKYSPRASDEFLEALRDMTDVPAGKDYPTDREGRIIIGATKSRVKKR